VRQQSLVYKIESRSTNMKKLIATISVGLLCSTVTWAVPSLQLDIEGGHYVGGTDETTYSAGDMFNLIALGLNPSGTYYISAAIVPQTSNPPLENFGSFTVNGTLYSAGNMMFGDPPIDDPNKNPHLGSHGIYDTHFAEISFSFSANTVPSYDTQDGSAGPSGQVLNTATFAVDVSGIAAGYSVHFDLYNKDFDKKGNYIIGDFAPFSHDAQSGHVPDGGTTLVLLAASLMGLQGLSRKFSKN
jgi:VPDSG-CTERM motif